jgi:hypothetical protein
MAGTCTSVAGDSDRVEVLDLETWRVVRHLPSGPDPELAALHPDGRRLLRRERGRQHGHRRRCRAAASC